VLVMTGANSAVGLRSMPVRYLFLDEVDGYPLDVDGEGDAISLAEARTRTFARRKILIVSTPTIAGASAIEREYEASDQRRYFVPCPHCDHRQWLRFEQLRWEKGQPETAAYVCESCDTADRRTLQDAMLEYGEWRAWPQRGMAAPQDFTSPALQPDRLAQWRDIAAGLGNRGQQGIRIGLGDQDLQEHRTGRNLDRGRRSPGLAAPAGASGGLPHRSIPAGGLLLVGGADVQKDRIEVSIWAFGRGKECWLIEHRVLMGDTARETVWKRLADDWWRNLDPCLRALDCRWPASPGYRLRHAGGLHLHAQPAR
jgi:phage terminase large subunit GpA-like protein